MKSLRAERFPRAILALLQQVAAGKLIYVPAVRRQRPNVSRDRAIRGARAAGASIPELARRHHLSESRVWEICRGLHPDRYPRHGGHHAR